VVGTDWALVGDDHRGFCTGQLGDASFGFGFLESRGESWRERTKRGQLISLGDLCMTLRNSLSSLRGMQEQSVSNCPMKEDFSAGRKSQFSTVAANAE
jgi:hypothetical protein